MQPRDAAGRDRQAFWLVFALLLAVTGLALGHTSARAAGTTRFVHPTGSDAPGCLQPSPCASIGYALGQADPGDEIKVAGGVYTPAQEIVIAQAVTLTGGFDPDGPGGWNSSNYTATPSILEGQAARRLLQVSGVNVGKVAVQNFVVRNGNASSSAQSPHIGGGVLVADSSDVLLRNLKVIGNVASTTDPGSLGGGIAFIQAGKLRIERSLILANTTSALGGGIGLRADNAKVLDLTVESSVIARNAAAVGSGVGAAGAGRDLINLRYVTLADNSVGTAAEAIKLSQGNATGHALQFNYTLLTGNTTGLNSDSVATPNVTLNGLLLDNGVTTAYAGTLPALPQPPKRALSFVDPAAGDYHLPAASPAIDLAGFTQKVDLEGRARPNSALCTPFTLCPLGRSDDYGAYEYVYTAATVRYVAPTGSDSSNNCLDSSAPCKTLDQAAGLSLGGDEVRVAQGTYTGAGSCLTAVLCITQGITVTGGFTLANWTTPSSDPALTVIDGETARRGVEVKYDAPGGRGALLNFTIRRGAPPAGDGGGMWINTDNASPSQNFTVRNVRFEENSAPAGGGGGLAAFQTVNTRIEDSVFISNVAGGSDVVGGGLYANKPENLRIDDTTFAGNSLPEGRGGGLGISDATGTATYTLTSLVVYGNLAGRPNDQSPNGGRGGGVFLEGAGLLRDSEVFSNTAEFSGGGVSTGSNNAMPTITRTIIRDNRAGVGGGFSIFLTGGATVQNTLIARNAATSTVGLKTGQTGNQLFLGGNAVHTPYIGVPDEPLKLINVTLADNTGAVPEVMKVEGTNTPATLRPNQLTNVLISGSPVGIQSDGFGIASLQKVLIANDVTTKTAGFGAGGLTGEAPLGGAVLYDQSEPAYPYQLQPASPGVDAGVAVPTVMLDLRKVSRPQGPAYDIGAYERVQAKQDQTISFAPLINRNLSDSPFTLQATASSGLTVSFASKTPAVCTVAGNQVTLVAVGTCTIEATQPGSATVNPAPPVTRSFTVVPNGQPAQRVLLPALDK